MPKCFSIYFSGIPFLYCLGFLFGMLKRTEKYPWMILFQNRMANMHYNLNCKCKWFANDPFGVKKSTIINCFCWRYATMHHWLQDISLTLNIVSSFRHHFTVSELKLKVEFSFSHSCSEVTWTLSAHRFRWKVFPLPWQTEQSLQEKAEVVVSVYLWMLSDGDSSE